MSKTHLIYLDGSLDLRAGGPSGYLANLDYGLKQVQASPNINIAIQSKSQTAKQKNALKRLAQSFKKSFAFFTKNSLIRHFYANHSTVYKNKLNDYYNWLNELDSEIVDDKIFEKYRNVKTIHCHNLFDTVKVANTLKKLHIRDQVKILFTSHAPESVSIEVTNNLKSKGYSEDKLLKIKTLVAKVEEKAFAEADILIFPSIEAMDPYRETIPNFSSWIKNKDIRFIPTGTIGIRSNLSKQEAKEKFQIPDNKKVFVYIGRHNSVKGYDVLCNVGPKILKRHEDCMFLIAGKADPNFPPPKNIDGWKELGWVNPAELLTVADYLILPNKRTYFDLILLETLSMGVPIIASNTGGNISVHNVTPSVRLYGNSNQDLEASIEQVIAMDENNLKQLRKEARQAYEKYYTAEAFARNYQSLIHDIYVDYHLI